MLQVKTTYDHGGRVQRETGEQQKVTQPVILAKTFAPQENRVHRAESVNDYGQQEEMTVCEPSHHDRLIRVAFLASCKCRTSGQTHLKFCKRRFHEFFLDTYFSKR
jgi:hypothetical protein